MTQSEVPLEDSGGPAPFSDLQARARARARARLQDTLSDSKIGWIVAVVRSDLRSWWLYASRPPSLRAWLRHQRIDAARVPAGSPLVGLLWAVDNWITGVAVRGVGIVFHLLGGAFTWLAGHPARRWPAFFIAASAIGYWLLVGR